MPEPVRGNRGPTVDIEQAGSLTGIPQRIIEQIKA
jgi:hypothetical protein